MAILPAIGIAAQLLGPLFGNSKVGKLAEEAAQLIDTDTSLSPEEKKIRAESEMKRITQENGIILEQVKGDNALALKQAEHSSIFVAGARPFMMWICSSIIGVWGHGTFIITATVVGLILFGNPEYIARGKEAMKLMDDYMNVVLSVVVPLLLKTSILSGLRTYEKAKGIARSTVGQPKNLLGQIVNKVIK